MTMTDVYKQRAEANREYAVTIGVFLNKLAASCIAMTEDLKSGEEAILRLFSLSEIAKSYIKQHDAEFWVMFEDSMFWAHNEMDNKKFYG